MSAVRWRLRWTWLWLALVAWLGACGGSGSEPVTVESEGIEMVVSVAPAELRVGENELRLELRDAGGEPIPGAQVEVMVKMHAMGAMPAMGGPAAVTELGEGRYRADFELAMGSTWNLAIAARTPDGRTARAEGSLTVGTPGARLEGVGRAAEPAPQATHGAGHSGEAQQPDMEAPDADMKAPDADMEAPDADMATPHPGEFRIARGRLQRVGVRTSLVESKPLTTRVRAVGRVVAEETTLEDVSLKVRGWVGKVHVTAVGDPVTQGEVLFTAYSPALYAAQEEYLQALRSQARARETSVPDRADYLVQAARKRLHLWDVAGADLDRLARSGRPLEHLPIRSPLSGYVVEKNLVDGSGFEPGQRLYRIAPLSQVWIEAEVYESDLPVVRQGQMATVTLPYMPDREFEAEVAWIYPTLDPMTRTARLRLALPNPDLALRPDMFANVSIKADRGERLVVPQSAVLHAGERSFVFVALGDGRFRPQPVKIGMRSGEELEILSGLAPGDAIVTSGTFLIASESRLRAALEQW